PGFARSAPVPRSASRRRGAAATASKPRLQLGGADGKVGPKPLHARTAMPSPSSGADPVLVEVLRGDYVESRHRGAAAVVAAAGGVVIAWGDVDGRVFAGSAIKPLQALPLVETGAAERYGLGPTELALACASHHGETAHAMAVGAWLERIELSAADLECG